LFEFGIPGSIRQPLTANRSGLIRPHSFLALGEPFPYTPVLT
jgi:hypothetical protein